MSNASGRNQKVHDFSVVEEEARKKRLGMNPGDKKSDAMIAFEAASDELDRIEKLYIPVDTPPPDSLVNYERQVWIDTLKQAGEGHFRLTEMSILEEFCWTKVRLLTARRSMGNVFDADEVRTLRSLQGALTNLGRMLRVSPQARTTTLREQRVALAIEFAKAELAEADAHPPVQPPASPREGLMFGGDPNAYN